MDIIQMDSLVNNSKSLDVHKILESFEERFIKIEQNMANDKNSIKELENQLKSLILMDENITLKLQISSQKEAEHSNLIKYLMEEKISKSENIKILNKFKELKTNNDSILLKLNNIEKRIKALESGDVPRTIPITNKEEEDFTKNDKFQENKKHVLLKFEDEYNINMSERMLKRKKEPWKLFPLKSNTKEFKVYDVEWFSRNLSVIVDKCSEITLHNIETLDVFENIILSHNTIITSLPETNLKFKNNSSIVIDANIIFNNLNITECHYEDKYLIEIKESKKLEFNNGFVEKNLGNKCLFGLRVNASLRINKAIFNNNCNRRHERKVQCILTESKANVYINECEFINHVSKDYPYSSGLFGVDGNLTIISTKFENNQTEVENWANFTCYNGNVFLDNIKHKNCSFIDFTKCENINIKNSLFMDNSVITNYGGYFNLIGCKNISIDGCIFRNNKNNDSGGALALYSCKGMNIIRNCFFQENSSKNNIGGAAIFMDSEAVIENINFTKNRSGTSGGAIFARSSEITCGNCTFESNTAREAGGAICIEKSVFNQTMPNKFTLNTSPMGKDIFRDGLNFQ